MAEERNRPTARPRPRGADRRCRRARAAAIERARGQTPRARSSSSAQPAQSAAATSTRRISRSWRPRSARRASSSRSWCAPCAGAADAYEIIAGERRWRAAQRAGLHDVPVTLIEVSRPRGARARHRRERAARRPQSRSRRRAAIERADRRVRLYPGRSRPRSIGKSRSHVANTLRLLKLPESVLALLERRHADRRATAGRCLAPRSGAGWRAPIVEKNTASARPSAWRSRRRRSAAKVGEAGTIKAKERRHAALEKELGPARAEDRPEARRRRRRRAAHHLQDA